MTNKVTSADGTLIAYDLLGTGPPAIVVGGATCDRAKTAGVSAELARHFTVVNYDRRGRGSSGDTIPYSVSREVEDLAALLGEVGGSAFVYGHSSGAGLVLHALAAGLPITRAVLHEPPYGTEEMASDTRGYAESLTSLLEAGRRDDALALFFTITGVPGELVDEWRTEPWWAGTAALAHTLAYDSVAMGDAAGGTVPLDLARRVVPPTLVLVGGASPEWMIDTDRTLAEAVPAGRLRVLAGEEHVVAPPVLVPVLERFFMEGR
ncbi:alpha/beta fold hydrolase [Actinophytocola sp.]|uniref:alpha/beta fold hydrolase n=1 Tax=Actinophytocola sp. TaxID=1872138 RepID=UPI003D6C06FE